MAKIKQDVDYRYIESDDDQYKASNHNQEMLYTYKVQYCKDGKAFREMVEAAKVMCGHNHCIMFKFNNFDVLVHEFSETDNTDERYDELVKLGKALVDISKESEIISIHEKTRIIMEF